MRTSLRLAYALAGASALWAAGCGDNSALCGEGTTNVKGYCVADGTATCGQGTIMDGNGNCVIDPIACAAGTVYDNGECVPEGTNVHADYEEGPEPNDGTVAG